MLTDVEHSTDVGVGYSPRETDLPLQSIDRALIVGCNRRQRLQRDVFMLQPQIGCFVDFPHPARAEKVDNLETLRHELSRRERPAICRKVMRSVRYVQTSLRKELTRWHIVAEQLLNLFTQPWIFRTQVFKRPARQDVREESLNLFPFRLRYLAHGGRPRLR